MKSALDLSSGTSPRAARLGFSRSTHALKQSTSSSLEMEASGMETPIPLMMTRFMALSRTCGDARARAAALRDR